jgi:transposase
MLREALESLVQGYDSEEVAHIFGIDHDTAYKVVSAIIDSKETK